jgi:hypothetical protein
VGTRNLTLDPLLYDFELPLLGVYHPLGFSVEIATNSHEVLAGADESWGLFRKVFFEPPVQLRIGVVEGGQERCPRPPVCRAHRKLLIRVADAENFSVSDLERGFAFCWLTPAVVENRAYLRYYFLEGMSWDLLEGFYLTSIHAACVKSGRSGVLLCGDSGAGKSSLAFGCARRGWIFLSDDSCCLVRKSSDRVVVGNPYQMRFRESAVEQFPELRDQRITRRLNGKLSIELPTASLPEIKTIFRCSVDFIVFLKRNGSSPPRLLPFAKHRAIQWFEQAVCYGEKEDREAQKASLLNLLTAQVFELHYSDLDSAVARLEAMVRSEDGTLTS